MEVLVIIILIVIAILVLGGFDNKRPVKEWSDEKLARMRGKLKNAHRSHFDAGNFEKYKEYYSKYEEVNSEILARAETRIHEQAGSESSRVSTGESSDEPQQESSTVCTVFDLQDYLAKLENSTNFSQREALEFFVATRNKYIEEFKAQGENETDAASMAQARIFNETPIPMSADSPNETEERIPETFRPEEVDFKQYVLHVISETGLSEGEAIKFSYQKYEEYRDEELSKKRGMYDASLLAKYRLNKEKPLP